MTEDDHQAVQMTRTALVNCVHIRSKMRDTKALLRRALGGDTYGGWPNFSKLISCDGCVSSSM